MHNRENVHHAGRKSWVLHVAFVRAQELQRVILPFYGLAGLAVPALAGIDTVRLGNPMLPDWTLPLGIALYVVGGFPIGWAMLVNPHDS